MRIKEEYASLAAENLARYFESEAKMGERIRANFSELASFAAQSAAKDMRTREFFSSGMQITSYLPKTDILSAADGAIDENKPLVNARLSLSEAVFLADFCVKTTELLETTAKLKPSPLLFASGEGKRGGKVAFADSYVLKNAFSEFEKTVSGLSPSPVTSFTEALEDTSAGVSDYCILPVESSREGILTGMYSLIERYELFICGICEIENDGLVTKFALLCTNGYGIIEKMKCHSIILRLSGGATFFWSKLYIGADMMQIEKGSGVSVPLGYTDGYAQMCTFSGSSDMLFAFLLYLGTMKIGYTLVGAY